MKTISTSLFLLFLCFPAFAQTLAFPGAEGFGRFATGGRGGDVYIVTNLNDAGPGSFRDAVSQPNRIVVFEVGGIINIDTRIVVSPNITIAGQTAPGDGIVIYGNGLSFTPANNCIVRYLRIRMGVGGDSGKDAVTITDNANVQIYDHVSVSWGRDENFSITGNADSITVQNSIIAQGLQTHSCGGLLEPSGALSFYRNLYIDNNTRNPKVKGINQFVNNVAYNWGGGGAYIMGGSAGNSYVNIINNYYISGPSSTISAFTRGTPTFVPYVSGNFYDSIPDGILNGGAVPRSAYEGVTTFRNTPYPYPMPQQLLSTRQAYDYVLKNAGANYPCRDQVDSFLVQELRSLGTRGALISDETSLPTGGPGQVNGGTPSPDTDRDGMPDHWELSRGLNPNNAADGKVINADGYTNLEKYINSLPDTGCPPAPQLARR
jgi:pectate lyase